MLRSLVAPAWPADKSISGLTAVPPTSLSGMALLILGGLRGPRDRKLGFLMFWALDGPLGPQEGQNHMF